MGRWGPLLTAVGSGCFKWAAATSSATQCYRCVAALPDHLAALSDGLPPPCRACSTQVGPYFPTGLRPISLFVDQSHTRAWPGGVGDVKVGGNYSPTILPQVGCRFELLS